MNFVKLIKRSIILSIGVVIFMQLDYYFILFIIYSFLGWCMEVILGLITNKKFDLIIISFYSVKRHATVNLSF